MPHTQRSVAKKTKIIATISDFRCEKDFVKKLYDEGMNVVRFNTAHIGPEDASKMLDTVRAVSSNIPVLVDTKGPEVRLTNMAEEFDFATGDEFKLMGNIEGISTKECIYVNYNNFVKDVEVGLKLLVDDGELAFDIIAKDRDSITIKATNDGKFKSRKSVNVPGAHIKLPALSEKDRDFIQWAIKADVDFIAHSFVRDRDDVLAIQNILDTYNSDIKIIAKIENQIGVDNLDEILDHAYGVMVARGDLGIEIEAHKIPSIQRAMIDKCKKRKKPVIVATQMLHTMIDNPRPTRAEVSDVANAIYQRTDCIMLSGETAYGKYPVESVRTMRNIALEVEANISKEPQKDASSNVDRQIPAFLARTAVQSVKELDIASIVSDTSTGRTVRYISAFRPEKPIFGICYSDRVKRELMLSYGVFAYKMDVWEASDEFKLNALQLLLNDKIVDQDDLVLIMGGNFNPNSGVSFVDISNAKTLLANYDKKA